MAKMELVIQPTLALGSREIVLVTHGECCFNSNDGKAVTWTEKGESIIKKKGLGLGLMVSDFYCACHGPLRFEDEFARQIIEPGENRDGYSTSDATVSQLTAAIPIFEKLHPDVSAFLL
ncbi:hypothetical protein V1504DRAFT_87280 [Lipomyces starkeyi]